MQFEDFFWLYNVRFELCLVSLVSVANRPKHGVAWRPQGASFFLHAALDPAVSPAQARGGRVWLHAPPAPCRWRWWWYILLISLSLQSWSWYIMLLHLCQNSSSVRLAESFGCWALANCSVVLVVVLDFNYAHNSAGNVCLPNKQPEVCFFLGHAVLTSVYLTSHPH